MFYLTTHSTHFIYDYMTSEKKKKNYIFELIMIITNIAMLSNELCCVTNEIAIKIRKKEKFF